MVYYIKSYQSLLWQIRADTTKKAQHTTQIMAATKTMRQWKIAVGNKPNNAYYA